MPKLVYHDSSGAKGTVEMGVEPVIIGRANDCQIQTQDGLVSRRHAKVTFDGRYYYIEDNGSANGVYVGQERVQRHQLRGGDTFRCGHLEVRFEVDDLNSTGIGMLSGGNVVRMPSHLPQVAKIANVPAPTPPVAPPPVAVAPPPVAVAPPPVAPPVTPPPPALHTEPTAPVRASQRSGPSAASNPPMAPMAHVAPMGPGDMTSRMQASASGVRPPGPPPAPAPSLGFDAVPQRPAQAGMPAAASASAGEVASLRGEIEAERRRRVEAEGERDVAQRRAEEAQRRAEEIQRKVDELSARPADGDTERLRRRVEQLESELRRKGGGGGGGGGGAAAGEALRAAETERDKLKARVTELEGQTGESGKLKARVTELETQLAGYAAYFGGGAAAVAPAAKVAELEAEVKRLGTELDAEKKRAAEAPKASGGVGEELERARRRIDQLESEARRRPVGAVTDEKRASDMRTELEAALRQLRDVERERESLREAISRGAGGPAKTPQPVVDNLTTVSDGLADVRAALRAAGDELALEQLEPIRNALRQACTQLGISQ